MKNSNVKIFTAFTYLLLLVLILGSVAFLVVQRLQLARQAKAYAEHIVDRINNSYIENGSFTATNFTNDVKITMEDFSDLIKVITIVDARNVMQNRFRFDSVNPLDDPNPNWERDLGYEYNSILYEEQSYDLHLPGQTQASVKILYQRLPVQLIKDVLQFDTIVILALLILSFLAFLIIPKRDPMETAWALQSVAEEDEIYHETENEGEESFETEDQSLETEDSWFAQDLPETGWEGQGDSEVSEAQLDDEFDRILDSGSFSGGIADTDDGQDPEELHDPWDDGDEKTESEADEEDLDDVFASLGPTDDIDDGGDKDIDLRFNDSTSDSEDDADVGGDDERFGLDETQIALAGSLEDLEESSDEEVGTDADEADEADSPAPEMATDLTGLEDLPSLEELNLDDELVVNLDEGLGDDEFEPIDKELNADIFSQIATTASMAAEEQAMELKESEVATDAPFVTFTISEEDEAGILSWLSNFLNEQEAGTEIVGESSRQHLLAALLEIPDEDIEIVRASFEQDLFPEASVLNHERGLTVFLPGDNIQQSIEALQSTASRLPASYLKNLRMGITGVSTERSHIEPATVLDEMRYALANCDEDSNISIFDANDQVFNRQRSRAGNG
ncbi:hypothetical protein P0082_08160 [Candidatus Haliotispira prima]|uniref:GGDEF domain-containing protein n=1 Tax=Candidatus Haliotispira prima TaxID=3034016 RepID=A0ABY8MES2_9SPIO|nr:hypothetical protein P0082_08160 [Candidatus Haliotispira prima]